MGKTRLALAVAEEVADRHEEGVWFVDLAGLSDPALVVAKLASVLQVREQLLILPIIGVLDSQRARQVTEQLLRAIRANRAKVVVIDITGVPTIDSTVANHLVQTVDASGLMGASVIITGLSSDIALSLDLSKMNAVGDLQGGIEEAERLLGYEVTRTGEPNG